tara:strand:- start:523 stop:768 length:246 start_codon:yes stop_codon:yes gene_type:complete
MSESKVEVIWPNGLKTIENEGDGWLKAASEAGVNIPIGCLGGSCGACEIEVNGKVLRSCINKIKKPRHGNLSINHIDDPYW